MKSKKTHKKGNDKPGKTSRKYKLEDSLMSSGQLECYLFNDSLDPMLDDGTCEHCRYFLTTRCPHVDEFLEEVEDMEPEL
ncbi:MAG: hypothetical protein N3F63_00265 [Thermoplasmata archaeon]|nr:hypothetical protein [Thermoplasmata archaeon]